VVATAPPDPVVRSVTSPDELDMCVRLYEEVFHLGPGDGSLNTRLLVGMVRNSGIVVGAFVEGQLIGFVLSFLALDMERQVHYQYSQLAVVAETAQGRGVGRQLKHAQRDAARAMGISEMHWSFDPFLVRNAHFNLNVLGARAVSLERNLYGTYGHGFDTEHTTDRLRAVWDLTDSSPRVAEAVPSSPLGVVSIADDRATLVVPALSHRRRDELQRLPRGEMLDAFEDLFAQGFAAVTCDLLTEGQATYAFERVSSP
jgi:predicted GNAT superfamily acetyltransferase